MIGQSGDERAVIFWLDRVGDECEVRGGPLHFQHGAGHVIGTGHQNEIMKIVFFRPRGGLRGIGDRIERQAVEINTAFKLLLCQIQPLSEIGKAGFGMNAGNQQFLAEASTKQGAGFFQPATIACYHHDGVGLLGRLASG